MLILLYVMIRAGQNIHFVQFSNKRNEPLQALDLNQNDW